MFNIKYPAAFAAALCVCFAACSGMSLRSSDLPGQRIEKAASDLASGRTDFYKLTQKGDSGPGSFYILDSEGVVLWHPSPVIIGNDFSKYDFVKRILQLKNGCIAYGSGKGGSYVFFKEIEKGSILCLAVDRNDYPSQSFDCY